MPRKQTLVHRRGLDEVKHEPVISTSAPIISIASFGHSSPSDKRPLDSYSSFLVDTSVISPQTNVIISPCRQTFGKSQVSLMYYLL